jgi:hypothetical protein
MVALFDQDNVPNLLKELSSLGFSAKTTWQRVDTSKVSNKPIASNRIFKYELPSAYEKDKYPPQYFDGTESDSRYPFGVITYKQPLSAKQRLQFNLIPIFDNLAEPYEAWKKVALSNAGVNSEWNSTIKEAKKLDQDSAKNMLGIFIATNAHESGNMEFVFGRVKYKDLGALAYRDFVGSDIDWDVIINQLQLELAA